jgi:hypothetical protein
MYKEGESFCHFIAENYGAEYLIHILDNWWRGNGFEEVVGITFGKPLMEIATEWEYWLKKKYFPRIAESELPDRVFKRLTGSGYNVKPVPIEIEIDGVLEERVVFKGNRMGYGGLYMTDDRGPGRNHVEALLKAERSPRFESLHLLKSSLDVSADGHIVFSSKRHARDVLYLLDIRTRKIVGEHRFDSFYTINSPTFSRDGENVVFAAAGKDGMFDLYTYELASEHLVRLTDDWYRDADPVFTPDGEQIVFASDRGEYGEDGRLNLFVYSLKDRQVSPYYTGRFTARAPSFAPDGESLIFTCDAGGHSDIYQLDTAGTLKRLTRMATGVFDPRFRPDGNSIVFSAYQNTSFQVFEMEIPDSVATDTVTIAQAEWLPSWTPQLQKEGALTRGAVSYSREFSFDIAQSAVSYDAFYGTVGGFQTVLSDVLGDHQYYFLVANNANTKDEFLSSFSLALSYFNRQHRLNYGYGAFRLANHYNDPVEGPIEEDQYGLVGSLAYPLSKFQRVEGSFFLRRSERDVLLGTHRRSVLGTQFVSFVHDNSLWDVSGPIDGWRLMLTFGYTGDLSNFNSLNRLAVLDARKYFRLGRYSAFATRFLGHFSGGGEPQRRYLGGSWDLRGYPRRGQYTRNVLLLSNELRFPLIDALFIGLPVANLGFQAIRGALFFDVGNAWEHDFGRMRGAVGVGARVSLGYFVVLRFDWARRTDFRTLEDKTRFEFFFGWNY